MNKETIYVVGVRRNLNNQLDHIAQQMKDCIKRLPSEIGLDCTIDDVNYDLRKYRNLVDSMYDLRIINKEDYSNLQDDIDKKAEFIQNLIDNYVI